MVEIPEVDAAEEAALRDLGVAQDRMEGRPEAEGAQTPEPPAPPAEVPAKPQPTQEKPVSSEPEPEKPPQVEAVRERDEKGRFKSPEAVAQENGEIPPAEKPLEPFPHGQGETKSRYAQARERDAKEAERYDRSWVKLQERKAEIEKREREFEERSRMAELQSQVQVPPPQEGGLDTQGWRKAYEDFRQQAIRKQSVGEDASEDWKNSMFSLENALQLEARSRAQMEQQNQAKLELDWRTQMDAAIAKNEDLQNPESDFYQEVDRIIKQEPYLFYVPGGFNKAVEIATLLLSAGSDSELRDENERLRARIEQLERGSQPARGGPGKPPQGAPNFDDMSVEQMEAHLKDLTAREDRALLGR